MNSCIVYALSIYCFRYRRYPPVRLAVRMLDRSKKSSYWKPESVWGFHRISDSAWNWGTWLISLCLQRNPFSNLTNLALYYLPFCTFSVQNFIYLSIYAISSFNQITNEGASFPVQWLRLLQEKKIVQLNIEF